MFLDLASRSQRAAGDGELPVCVHLTHDTLSLLVSLRLRFDFSSSGLSAIARRFVLAVDSTLTRGTGRLSGRELNAITRLISEETSIPQLVSRN